MVLRKWRSNSTQVLQHIPEKLRETSDLTLCNPAGSLKTLGVHWSTEADAFFMATPELTEEGPVTKRIISSACAKTFDILGWYSPALIQAKSLLQQLWIAGRAWDDPAPEDVADKFITWRKELKHISLHAVPRKLTQNNLSPVTSMQLHGFADASETGYGAQNPPPRCHHHCDPGVSQGQGSSKEVCHHAQTGAPGESVALQAAAQDCLHSPGGRSQHLLLD